MQEKLSYYLAPIILLIDGDIFHRVGVFSTSNRPTDSTIVGVALLVPY